MLKSNASGSQGLVLLKRHDMSWRADTLLTWEGPRSVDLAPNADSTSFHVAFAQSYFEKRRPWPDALFTARYDSSWHDLQKTIDLKPRYVSTPVIRTHGPTKVLSWRSGLAGVDPEVVEWALDRGSGTFQRLGTLAPLLSFDRPAVAMLDAKHTAFLIRNGESRSELRVFLAKDTSLHELGTIRIPLDNLSTLAVRVAAGELMVVTGWLGTVASDPPAANYLTTLRVRCSTTRN